MLKILLIIKLLYYKYLINENVKKEEQKVMKQKKFKNEMVDRNPTI